MRCKNKIKINRRLISPFFVSLLNLTYINYFICEREDTKKKKQNISYIMRVIKITPYKDKKIYYKNKKNIKSDSNGFKFSPKIV